jgi:2-oxoacid:acceptor oxidoreductase gamma subunit (pyruvate/2-ketoisovalerate family)
MADSLEIRFHGRGGQGGVTCAKIVAAAHAALGRHVQTFGDYAGERSGAPVRAYTRVADAPITNRNKVYAPDQLVVLDSHLLGPELFAGLKPGGSVLINTAEPLEACAGRWPQFTVAVVDATTIARAHKIGTRTVVIVNTTIAGAYARLHGIELELLRKIYEKLGLLGNFPAAKEAYDSVRVRGATAEVAAAPRAPAGPAAAAPSVLDLTAHIVSLPTTQKTGAWTTQRPRYVETLAPCNAWCPAGNDVIGFVQSLHAGDARRGAAILARTTPLPGVCGRVCPAPCMEGCNRAEYDGAVNLRGLERWIADAHAPPAVAEPCERPRRIAVVGSGPAGLSATWTLARRGHRVVLFEGEAKLGGLLRTGIPAYRLPRDVLDREIAAVLALGVETRTGRFLAREELAGLLDEFEAVVLASGLQKLTRLEVPGAELGAIEQGLHFLHRVNVDGGARLSGHVVVLGGGNTAMDCARSALRCGADRVTVVYRRTRAEMPAIREEIEQALEEGIELLELRAPVACHGIHGNRSRASGNGGESRVQELELAEVELGPADASGRRRPLVTGRTARLGCDHVLLALGQGVDARLLPAGWELRDGRVHQGGRPLPVFAAGDFATGDGTVTHALGSGRRAAELALAALGDAVVAFERPDRTLAVPATDLRFDHFAKREMARGRVRPAARRVRSFTEVDDGLADAGEAHRCFSCGHCTRCDTCLVFCPEGIIRREAPGYAVDYSFCKGCGICVEECPRAAMELTEP